MSEWKPGDVALVDSWRGERQIAFRVYRSGVGADWCVLDGTDTRGLEDSEIRSAYPVAVIDPENPEQLGRLIACVSEQREGGPASVADRWRNALREFAAPTPPPCDASLSIGGFRYQCEGDMGHTCAHGNSVADAIWRAS